MKKCSVRKIPAERSSSSQTWDFKHLQWIADFVKTTVVVDAVVVMNLHEMILIVVVVVPAVTLVVVDAMVGENLVEATLGAVDVVADVVALAPQMFPIYKPFQH